MYTATCLFTFSHSPTLREGELHNIMEFNPRDLLRAPLTPGNGALLMVGGSPAGGAVAQNPEENSWSSPPCKSPPSVGEGWGASGAPYSRTKAILP